MKILSAQCTRRYEKVVARQGLGGRGKGFEGGGIRGRPPVHPLIFLTTLYLTYEIQVKRYYHNLHLVT